MIVATILLGPGADLTVGDAVRSAAAHVDAFLLIESGGGSVALDEARRAVVGAGSTALEAAFAWTGDYGAARQYALEQARLAGATYSVTLDPDERLALKETFRARLQAYPKIDVWILQDRDTRYFKERVIRCAAADLHWHGIVCESLEGEAVRGKLDGAFWELTKNGGQNLARYERGVTAADRMIASGDDRFKWRRHKGSCLAGLGRFEEALDEYRLAYAIAAQPEERAWSAYLICEQLVLREQFEEAWTMASESLARHAGFLPEFGWILGYIEYLIGDDQNASRWAQLALHFPEDTTRVSLKGVHCVSGCRSILDNLHGQAPAGQVRVHHVNVPLDERIGEQVRAALHGGGYEGAEYRALKSVLRKSDRVLELGAGLGVLATYCAKRLEDNSAVLTVEADPLMAPLIRATFAANDVSPTLLIAAASGSGAPMRLARAPEFWSTKAYPLAGERPGADIVLVDGVALPALLSRHSPSVLVIDIEGGETSLVETPLPGVRAVLIEVHSEEADTAVHGWLSRQGFGRRDVARRVRLYERTL